MNIRVRDRQSIGNSNGILALAHRGHNSENALGASQRPPLATAPRLRRWPQSQRSTAVRAAPRSKASRGQKPPGHATQDRLG
jgi:hypothetical protein